MIEADKDVREHIDGVANWTNRSNTFEVRLALYAHQLEKENAKLRATISGREFDSITSGMRDGAPVWLRKLASDLRNDGYVLTAMLREASDDADCIEVIATRIEMGEELPPGQYRDTAGALRYDGRNRV